MGPRRPTAGTAGTALRSSRMDLGTACWSPCQAYRRTPPRRWCCGRMRFEPERLNAADRTTAIHTIHLCCCGRYECDCRGRRHPCDTAPYSIGRYCRYDTCGEKQKKEIEMRFVERRSYIRPKTCRGRVIILLLYFFSTGLCTAGTMHPSGSRRGGGRYTHTETVFYKYVPAHFII